MDEKYEEISIEQIKKLYNSVQKVWPDNDLWHQETQNRIKRLVEKIVLSISMPDAKILNAGAGGTLYNIKGEVFDCDIAENTLRNSQNPILSSIEDLPCDDSFFNLSICVGSVINYCDAVVAISELSRTLRNNGMLILEFERSDSGEFLLSKQHHKAAFQKEYSYNDQYHRIWLYSEKYIKNALQEHHLRVLKTIRFHSTSSLIYRIFKNETKAAHFIHFDWITRLVSYQLAHNALVLCKKY